MVDKSVKIQWPWPIVSMLHSSCAVVFGYEVYGEKCPKIIDWLHTLFTNISDAKYWLLYRFHPEYQYHLIRTGLTPAYHCEDELILYGCMAMLCRYIEAFGYRDDKGRSGEIVVEEFNKELNNNPGSKAPDGVCQSQAARQSEALAIYRWWKYEKPADEKRRDELLMLLYQDKDRMSFVHCEDTLNLSKIKFKEFEGDEITMDEEKKALEEKIDDDEQKMLHRLIDIRRSLWT